MVNGFNIIYTNMITPTMNKPWTMFIPILVVLLSLSLVCSYDDNSSPGDNSASKYYDFKMDISPGVEECFYQNVIGEEVSYYATVEVLRGADDKVDVTVRNSRWDLLLEERGTRKMDYHEPDVKDKQVTLCIDNIYSRFGSVLVYVFISVFNSNHWEDQHKEFEAVENVTDGFIDTMGNIETSFVNMSINLMHNRINIIRDLYVVDSHKTLVAKWSICVCIVMVAAALGQVYMVRRLFRTNNITPTTAKPRA